MNSIVDIIYGASACYTFKKSNINDLVIEFDTIFSIANLNDIDNFILTYPENLFDDYDFSKEIKLLDILITNHYIRIWCSKKDVDSYILLCYLCNYLKDKTDKISVIYSEDYNENYNTPAIIRENEFKKALEYEHNLSSKEINELANIFNYIKEKHCELRVIKDGQVSLVNYDYYNNIIIDLLKEKPLKISTLVGQLLGNYDHLIDTIYCYLIERMIDSDIIEIVRESNRFFDNVIALK